MDENNYLIGLISIPAVSNRINKLVAHFGSAKAAWSGSLADYQNLPGIDHALAQELIRAKDSTDLNDLIVQIERRGISWLSIRDDGYPPKLLELDEPPLLIFYKGDLIKRFGHAISIVGARRASAYGKSIAFEMAKDLSCAGVTVISGVARGIDTAAHFGALEGAGKTIGVLGCGHDLVYPPENKNLYAKIGTEGSLVSEYIFNTRPFKWNFPARNRIISGLSSGVVVVEASEKSGALLTVDFALEQNREVFAVPGNVKSPLSRGPHNLIRSGACLVESAADIIEALGIENRKVDNKQVGLNDVQLKALDYIAYSPKHIDEIGVALGLSAQETASLLTKLEITGHLKQDMGKNYIRLT